MSKWARTSAKSVLLTVGFVALGGGVAFADSDVVTSGNGSILGGNQAVVNADIPVNVSGNAIGAVGGVAGASATDTGALVKETHGHRHHHSAPAEYTAMDLVDEAARNATVLPLPDTSGVDAGVLRQSAPREHQSAPGGQYIATSGNGSILGGNQAVVDLDVPVNVAGNAVGAVGGVAGASATDTGALVKEGGQYIATSGNGSVLGGNQLVVDGDVPVNVSGNAIGAVAGIAGASSTGDGAAVVHQSATESQSAIEHQAGALDAVPLVSDLPEVPVSDMLPATYEVSETTTQAVEEHAPEQADQLPEASQLDVVDPVGQALGAVGVGL